jgi:MFS family permease
MLAASMIPLGTALVVSSFSVGGLGMWLSAGTGSVLIALAYPAMAVYRAELFPTQRRGRAASIITASSLLGGSIGLIAGGLMIDNGLSYGNVMAILAVGPLTVGLIVLVSYPETAHRELEDINPQDRTGSET